MHEGHGPQNQNRIVLKRPCLHNGAIASRFRSSCRALRRGGRRVGGMDEAELARGREPAVGAETGLGVLHVVERRVVILLLALVHFQQRVLRAAARPPARGPAGRRPPPPPARPARGGGAGGPPPPPAEVEMDSLMRVPPRSA